MRLKSIILTELIHDRLIAYEKLEEAMNYNVGVDKKIINIKKSLKKIVTITLMINQWQEILNNEPNDSNPDKRLDVHKTKEKDE